MAVLLCAVGLPKAAGVDIDEQLRFALAGSIECYRSCGSPINISLVGSRLGDTVDERPQIAVASLARDQRSFLLVGSVLLGYKDQASVDPTKRAVQLRVESKGCGPLDRELPITNFKRDKHGYYLDIGKLKLICSDKR